MYTNFSPDVDIFVPSVFPVNSYMIFSFEFHKVLFLTCLGTFINILFLVFNNFLLFECLFIAYRYFIFIFILNYFGIIFTILFFELLLCL